jgi:hypothetical protein
MAMSGGMEFYHTVLRDVMEHLLKFFIQTVLSHLFPQLGYVFSEQEYHTSDL